MRKIGVELELIAPASRYVVADKLQAAGIPAEAEGYNHTTRGHWKITTDGSLRTTRGYTAMEVVSPILRDKKGMAQLETVLRVLNELGARTNSSCGVHVHLQLQGNGTPGAQAKAAARIARLYSYFEQDVIDKLTTRKRRGSNNSYCQSVRMSGYNLARLQGAKTVRDVSAAVTDRDRYHKVNLEAYGRYGTVEFRHLNGTLSWEVLRNWIEIAQAIVRYGFGVGKKGADGHWTTHRVEDVYVSRPAQTVDSFVQTLELSEDVHRWLYTRYNYFARAEGRSTLRWTQRNR